LLGIGPGGEVLEHEKPAHVSPLKLMERASELGGGLKWVVDGDDSLNMLIVEGAKRAGCRLVECSPEKDEPEEDEWMITPFETLARSVAELGWAQQRKGTQVGAGELRACYVRASDAELKRDVTGRG
ncbi:MAG: hypothetical protein WCD76_10765, partial [Pyrinomonadaceae bacterium]